MTRQQQIQTTTAAFALCLAIVLFTAPHAAAQFGGDDDPFGGGGVKPPVPPVGGAPTAPTIEEKDPVVLAIREANPTTPSDLTRAIQTMMDLGRPDEAGKYLKKLIALDLDKDAQIALQREYGSGFFIGLSRYKPLAPEGIQFGRLILETAYQAARDPAYLATLVKQLSDPSLGQRRVAISELRRADTAAVAPMVQALADKSRSSEHAAIRAGLAALGRTSAQPLIGVLEAPDLALRIHAVLVLGRLEARSAVPYLLRPFLEEGSNDRLRAAAEAALLRIIGDTPARFDAERFLHRRATKFFSGVNPKQPDADDMVVMWHWNDDEKLSAPVRYPAEAAALVEASRAAADLYAIAPKNNEYRRLYLMTKLESEKLVGGLDLPLQRGAGTAHAEAVAAGVEFIEDVLVEAMRTNHAPAAIAAAEVLGEIGDDQLLLSDDGSTRPLARAMRHRDRRVRYAAVNAILQIDPTTAFPGSSWLPEVLGYLVSSFGERHVLIGHPRTEQAQTLVGQLSKVGLVGESAADGRRLLQAAKANADVEMILITDVIDSPEAKRLIQMLRSEEKTANIPIGLLARSENLVKMKLFARDDPLTGAFPWPYKRNAVAFTVQRLMAMSGRQAVTWETRLNHAADALIAIETLAANRNKYPFYDLLRQQDAVLHALQFSSLSDKAAKVLAVLATPQAQRALVNVASESARPLQHRQAAAAAFSEAVRRRRVLLTKDEIVLQYERYNLSESLDPDTQTVLASILDTIEGKKTPK